MIRASEIFVRSSSLTTGLRSLFSALLQRADNHCVKNSYIWVKLILWWLAEPSYEYPGFCLYLTAFCDVGWYSNFVPGVKIVRVLEEKKKRNEKELPSENCHNSFCYLLLKWLRKYQPESEKNTYLITTFLNYVKRNHPDLQKANSKPTSFVSKKRFKSWNHWLVTRTLLAYGRVCAQNFRNFSHARWKILFFTK